MAGETTVVTTGNGDDSGGGSTADFQAGVAAATAAHAATEATEATEQAEQAEQAAEAAQHSAAAASDTAWDARAEVSDLRQAMEAGFNAVGDQLAQLVPATGETADPPEKGGDGGDGDGQGDGDGEPPTKPAPKSGYGARTWFGDR